jgi:multiple sugar transport system permease protein
VLIYAALTACAFIMTAPVLFMIVGSFKADALVLQEAGTLRALVPTSVTLENFEDVFERVPFGRFLLNSALINLAIVVLGLVVNSAAGYALARLKPPAGKLLVVFVLAVLVIPFESIAVPLFFQLSALGWRDSLGVQIAPFVANPLSIYLFYSFFLNMPKAYEEAAYMDGAGTIRTFVMIIVPNAKPVFAAVTIVTFLFNWGAYLWPLLMTTREAVRPLPLAVATFHTLPPLQWGDILAFGVMMVLPVLAVFIIFQRWFVRGVALSGLKG